jgi:endonuclease/exonuclease/phosphatase (EEP) superfamily protein YafD
MEKETRPNLLNWLLRFTLFRLPSAALVYLSFLTVATFLAKAHRYFELTAHFRLQYLVGSVIAVLIFAAWRAWRLTAVALVCVILNGVTVIPWYLPPATAVGRTTSTNLRLLLFNVLTSNTQYPGLINLVRAEKPDLLIVQEMNRRWMGNLNALRDDLPHSCVEPREDNFGIAVYSRIPFEESRVVRLLEIGLPSIQAKISVNGQSVSILTTHPLPPLGSQEAFSLRNAQLSEASKLMRQLAEPKVLIGDLNTTVWSPFYFQLVEESGLVDARKGFGLLPTWPANFSLPVFRIPIDHCLISPLVEVKNIRTGPYLGSDHLPLIVDLGIHPANEKSVQ